MKTFTVLLTFITLFLFSGMVQGQGKAIKDFATKSYIHGIPYAEAKSFGSQALPELYLMLNTPEYEAFKSNIVATIGMIGDESAFLPLKNYLESQEGEISQPTFLSLLVVFQSLGHISQNGNTDIVDYLAQWTRPDHWKKADLKFSFQNYHDQTMAEVLGRLAIQGLGISGSPKAIEVLEGLKETEPQLKANFNWEWSDNIEEAIELNRKINRRGAQEVFGSTDQY